MAEPFIGEIRVFSFHDKLPANDWHLCDGSLLNINSNQALYSLLGTFYGGDGRTTFGLPDLRGRVPIAIDRTDSSGLFNKMGLKGGEEQVTLTTQQVPIHTHAMQASSNPGTVASMAGALFASIDSKQSSALVYGPGSNPMVSIDPKSMLSTGGNAAHNNIQPYLVLAYYIATTGLYPPHP